MYAKLNNGKLLPGGYLLVIDGKLVVNPTHEQLINAGYLPVQYNDAPKVEDGYYKRSRWVQTEDAIVQKWTVLRETRKLTQSEVNKMLIAQQINTLTVDDNTALRMIAFYPEWAEGMTVAKGDKLQRNGKLWRCVQDHTTQVTWEPENAASLWEQVNETHDGTLEDPIPYSGNMALENGEYYVQKEIIYLCNRDTVNPVYNALSELVGLYVVEV